MGLARRKAWIELDIGSGDRLVIVGRYGLRDGFERRHLRRQGRQVLWCDGQDDVTKSRCFVACAERDRILASIERGYPTGQAHIAMSSVTRAAAGSGNSAVRSHCGRMRSL